MAVKPADFPPLVVEYTGDFLAGVDEVGRGPLVGSVVAAAVILVAVATAHVIPIILWRPRVLLGWVVCLVAVVELGLRVPDFLLVFALDVEVHDDENAADGLHVERD